MSHELAPLRYDNLLGSGLPTTTEVPAPPTKAIIDLLSHMETHGALDVGSPFRIAPHEVRRLRATLHSSPDAGWVRLASLLPGANAVRFDTHGCAPLQTPERWENRSDTDVRIALTEAYSRYLLPPSAAAGLFVALGIHPLYGLRLAKAKGRAGDDTFRHFSDEMPEAHVTLAERASFGALATFFLALSQLPHGQSYDLDTIGAFFHSAAAHARHKAQRGHTDLPGCFPVFGSSQTTDTTSARMAASDIIHDVLITAGMATLDGAQRVVFHPALSAVAVGDLTQGERRLWLSSCLPDVDLTPALRVH